MSKLLLSLGQKAVLDLHCQYEFRKKKGHSIDQVVKVALEELVFHRADKLGFFFYEINTGHVWPILKLRYKVRLNSRINC